VAGRLAAIGIVTTDWGQRYAQLFDPDGQPVDLFASL
jgi:uncharacterized glyoxalase superfamily protein PhnB